MPANIIGIGNYIGRQSGGSLTTPTFLLVTPVTSTRIDLTWIGNGDISIERSTDSINYSEIDTVLDGLNTYSDITCVANIVYYYRVKSYKGTKYSDPSNVDSNSPIFNNGKVILSFDDGYVNQYLDMYPLAVTKGIKFTVFANINSIESGSNCLTWAQIQEMYAAGIDVQDHSNNHVSFVGLNEVQLIAQLDAVDAAFAAHSLPQPKCLAYPGGQYNTTTETYLRSDGRRLTARAIGLSGYYENYRDSNKLSLSAYPISNLSIANKNILKAEFVKAAANKTAIYVYGHGVNEDDPITHPSTSTADIEELIDYGLSLGLDFITHTECRNLLLPSYVHPTVDFTLTPTGTGAGVATLSMKAMTECDITLTGGAKFYTNAAGTTGESTTWHLTNDSVYSETIYLKCTTGSSTMNIPYSKIQKWEDWKSNGNVPATNWPNITGDLSVFTWLDYLRIKGNNTLSGNLSSFVLLTMLELGDGCTCTMDVTLMTKLTQLITSGVITSSGSIDLLISLNTIIVTGSSNLSGSISNKTLLEILNVTSGNTLSGDLTLLTNLGKLTVISNQTIAIPTVVNNPKLYYLDTTHVFTNTEVNQVLADFWANRDTAKDGTDRYIKLARSIYSGEPLGQGLTDKAALEAYRSPNNEGDKNLWTVTTNSFDSLTLTATGDGTGVATFKIEVTADTTFLLDGTAKFYTNAAGTTGEADNWAAGSGAYRTTYIRCPSGTATLRWGKNKLKTIRTWTSGTNAPSIGGDISGFTNMTLIAMLDKNTLSGDLSTLTAMLEYTNTLNVGQTFSNVTNVTHLCNLVVPVSCTLTSANVNQILADFITNKDASKTGATRVINIAGAADSGAPTGQGALDKTTLQSYHSPTPPGTAAHWTVTTR